ncbi:hypothetical protein DPMN_032218 [Dreissena polymorpha]|uniref:Uncharacterized protein n=1 Tax=Dreissena polymorpha TaxID=45954 RepID=A0A9D4M3S7_DREPO|nr:hypothetical protein DPMN_032218 [Dreissena polymorpha]
MTTRQKRRLFSPGRVQQTPAKLVFDNTKIKTFLQSPNLEGQLKNATTRSLTTTSDHKRPKTSQDLEGKLLCVFKTNTPDLAIVNHDTLWTLYHTVLNKGGTTIEEFVRSRISYNKGNSNIEQTECDGTDKSCELSAVGAFIAETLNDDQLNPYKSHTTHTRDKTRNTSRNQEENEDDIKKNVLNLFLFAILFNREELAEITWTHCKDHIGAALIASSLLKKLSKIAKMAAEFDIAEDILKVSMKYEQKAYDVLTLCYKSNQGNAHNLLIRRLDEPFGSTTLLDIAYANNMFTFMSHTCCQTKLNLIWRGRIAIFTHRWQIFLAIFLPLFVFCIKFRQSNNAKNKSDAKKVNDNTIDTSQKSIQTTYSVRACDNEDEHAIGIGKALIYLYTSPISVFVVNSVSYLAFLGLFAYFVCVDLNENMTFTEWVVWGWSFTMLCEEFRQMINSGGHTFTANIRKWFAFRWNIFDMFNYMLFIVTIIMRFRLTGKQFDIVRYFYSFTVATFSLRSLQNLFVEKNIGPKVIMIKKMMIDLFIFSGILSVFLFSIGVIYQASLFPNSPAAPKLLESLIYIPYWQLFGEVTLGYLEGDDIDNCTRDESIWRPAGGVGRCPEHKPLVPFLGAVYMFLTNILLVNLLIAMFSNTFQKIQDRSEKIWKFYLYNIIREYYERPVLVPPFIIIIHIFRTVNHFFERTNGSKSTKNAFLFNGTDAHLVQFENTQTQEFLRNRKPNKSPDENSDNEPVEAHGDETVSQFGRVAGVKIVISGENEAIENFARNPAERVEQNTIYGGANGRSISTARPKTVSAFSTEFASIVAAAVAQNAGIMQDLQNLCFKHDDEYRSEYGIENTDVRLVGTKHNDATDAMKSTVSETDFKTKLASILASAIAHDVNDLKNLCTHHGNEFTGPPENHSSRTVSFVDETSQANNILQHTASSTSFFEMQLATIIASAIANDSESIQELRHLFEQSYA